jgi:RNA polymerase sigma-70 factor (ECF subfamily)
MSDSIPLNLAGSDLASALRRAVCLHALVKKNHLDLLNVTGGTSAAFVQGMSRSKNNTTPSDVPASSRLLRKTDAPARQLRVVAEGSSPSVAIPGTHAEFEQACLPHQAELYGVAMRIARDPDTAKDLVQETLLRAMCAWESFQPGSNLRAWLFRILTNAFINGYRKRRRLGPEYRDVVERADLRGEKYKDIADALHVPIGTVMSRLFRARRVLETELADFAAKDYGIKRAA